MVITLISRAFDYTLKLSLQTIMIIQRDKLKIDVWCITMPSSNQNRCYEIMNFKNMSFFFFVFFNSLIEKVL